MTAEMRMAVEAVYEELDVIYDVYKGKDYWEITGTTGGDVRRLRIYPSGAIGAK